MTSRSRRAPFFAGCQVARADAPRVSVLRKCARGLCGACGSVCTHGLLLYLGQPQEQTVCLSPVIAASDPPFPPTPGGLRGPGGQAGQPGGNVFISQFRAASRRIQGLGSFILIRHDRPQPRPNRPCTLPKTRPPKTPRRSPTCGATRSPAACGAPRSCSSAPTRPAPAATSMTRGGHILEIRAC